MGRAGSSGQIEAEGKCWLWAARGAPGLPASESQRVDSVLPGNVLSLLAPA